jgi:hypothetical protein
MIDVPRLVSDLVAGVTTTSTAAGEEQFLEVLTALRAVPGVDGTESPVFRLAEFEIRVGMLSYLEQERAALARVADLSLVAAPEYVTCIPAGERHGVLVSRYTACPGERLRPAESTEGPFREAAREQFRKDMNTLVEHGLVHPYARGMAHWLVSSETGALLLESWGAVRPCGAAEGARMLATIERRLEERS